MNKLKEIPDSNKKNNIACLDCVCGDFYHRIRFCWYVWDDGGTKELDVEFISGNYNSFWQKLKDCYRYLFKNEELLYSDIILNEDALNKLENLIKDYKKA